MPTMAEALQRQINVHDPYFNRGTMLPFGERTFPNNPHSRTEFAVPGAIYDPVMLGAKSMQQALSGQRVNPDDVTRLSLDLGMLGAPVGMATAPAGALGMFAGKMAKTADLNAMKQAEELLAKGADRGDVWKQTGWFKDVDGHMKFEIDDSGADFVPDNMPIQEIQERQYKIGSMGSGLEHNKLYSAYPEIRNSELVNYDFKHPDGLAGQFNKASEYMGSPDTVTLWKGIGDKKSTLLHELQHNVQQAEGFARGGAKSNFQEISSPIFDKNPQKASRYNELLESAERKAEIEASNKLWMDKYEPMWTRLEENANSVKDFDKLDGVLAKFKEETQSMFPLDKELESLSRELGRPKWSADDQYKRLAGEAEARNVQTRMDYTPEQRRASPPWETLDVPENELIVRMQNALMGNK